MTNKTIPHCWLPGFVPASGNPLKLFCFPHAGGAPTVFRKVARFLTTGVQCCAVQYPGQWERDARSRFRKIGPLVEAAMEGLAKELSEPFALFGYSMGALVAFDLAHRLASLGGPQPVHLFVASHAAPQVPRAEPDLHQLDDRELLEQVQARYGPVPPELLREPGFLQLLLPVLRADLELVETYQHQERPLLHCGITAMAGDRDPTVTEASLAAWKAHTQGPFAAHWFPAPHFILETHAQGIARTITQVLAPRIGCASGD